VRPDGPEARALYEDLLARMAGRLPQVTLVYKREFLHQWVVHWLLWALTLGGQDRYRTEYVTTLGRRIYLPDSWEEGTYLSRYAVLRHELVHVAQFERYGWLGMVLLYGFLPLPLGLSWGRARLEWEAYEVTLRVTYALGGAAAARDPALRRELVQRFTGPDYGWMWPFPGVVGRWIDRALDALDAEAERPGGVAGDFRDGPGVGTVKPR
jgi:hypothetical protein